MHDNCDILRARSNAAADVVVRQFERIICILKGFNPNQPRDEIGRWSGSGGGERTPSRGVQVADASNTQSFSPDKSGWHYYPAGPNLVCTAQQGCSKEDMADQLSRFAVPGQDPRKPLENNNDYNVLDPVFGMRVGTVNTRVSSDGLVVINRTNSDHIFFNGIITRTATQDEDGSWYVTTQGVGNNVYLGMNLINQDAGPSIFSTLDQQMRDNIRAHHRPLQKALSGFYEPYRSYAHTLYASDKIAGAAYASQI